MKNIMTTIRNVFSVKDLRSKILFTLFILIIYRLGAQIPVPFISNESLTQFQSYFSTGIFQYLNMFSGNAMGNATLFALSISPYITSSIVMQLLCVAIPKLERMSKEEDGKKKITQITRYVTVGLALITSIGYYTALNNQGAIQHISGGSGMKFFTATIVIACYCAGASLIMWLGEKINESGIGNGISMILFANIVASFPGTISRIFTLIFNTEKELPGLTLADSQLDKGQWWIGSIIGVLGLVLCIGLIAFMVYMSNSERRLNVQYSKRVVGRKMYGGQSTTLPLKVNMTGVMPIIFASSIVSIPATIATFAGKSDTSGGFWGWMAGFNQYSWLYILLFALLLIAFAYFYVAISFNPVEVANNLQKNGGTIQGLRPGKQTADFIKTVLSKVTFIGALCLLIIAILPMVLGAIGHAAGYTASYIDEAGKTVSASYNWTWALTYFSFSGNSLLIVIGVILETVRDIEAQMTMRNFKGFL